MANEDRLIFSGKVVKCERDSYDVKIDGDARIVKCKISGSIRINNIRIYLDDAVTIEVSAYEPEKGRIIIRGSRREKPFKSNFK